MPVYNDFEAVEVLLSEIDTYLYNLKLVASVVLIDDASNDSFGSLVFSSEWLAISSFQIVRLRRNLGHQRAIAIGLAWAYEELTCDAVLIMDADGQDQPKDIPRLIAACETHENRAIVFAERSRRRPEGLVFKLGYQCYKLLHVVLVGIKVRVGNFSIIPYQFLARLVAVSELWNHYAAGVFKAQLPRATVSVERGRRIRGRSTMDFPALLAHGLSAISVFSERAGARLVLFLAALSVLLAGAVVTAPLIGTAIFQTVPAWVLMVLGLMVILFSQVVIVSCGVVFFIMSNRERLGFLPLRDYRYFLLETVRLSPADPNLTRR